MVENIRQRPIRLRLIMFAGFGFYVGVALFAFPYFYDSVLHRSFPFPNPEILNTLGGVVLTASILAGAAAYLGIFESNGSAGTADFASLNAIRRDLSRELRSIQEIAAKNVSQHVNVAIGDELKPELVQALLSAAKGSLSEFVKKETFKTAAAQNSRDVNFGEIGKEFHSVIIDYKEQMNGWRRNANINLIIGLGCAVAGIFVMWQTLIYIQLAIQAETGGQLNWNDFYRFISRLGLVLLIESVAFFFLKLYREDRAMIRYFRNEITNLESRALALKASIAFAKPDIVGKLLATLMSTERNFVLKKGERVLSDLVYENNEIILEKLLNSKILNDEGSSGIGSILKRKTKKRSGTASAQGVSE